MQDNSKEAALAFIENNKDFFTMPLRDQATFKLFYQKNQGLQDISAYSAALQDVLYRNRVLANWWEGDFESALNVPAVRKFLMDNQAHPAITLWQTKYPHGPVQDTSSIFTLKCLQAFAEKIVKLIQPLFKRDKETFKRDKESWTKTCLAMDTKTFNHYFNIEHVFQKNNSILINAPLLRLGITGDLFKNQDDFYQWFDDIINKKQAQQQGILGSTSSSASPSENEENEENSVRMRF